MMARLGRSVAAGKWTALFRRDQARAGGRPALGELSRRRERWFFALVSPWLAGFLALQAVPLAGALGLSGFEWSLPRPPTFVGAAHFEALAHDPFFARALFNSLYFAAGTVPASVGLGLALALLLNRPRAGMGVFRTIFLLPAVISGVATALAWGWILNPQYGWVNSVLAQVGIQGPAWLQDEAWAMPAVMLIQLWTGGVNMVVYLAALQGVPHELREAARIDGADAWQGFWNVTWPWITPATFYLLIANLIGAFQVFTPIYVLTRGGPYQATLTLPVYIYLNAFPWGRPGYAAALACVLVVTVLGLTLALSRFTGRRIFYAQ